MISGFSAKNILRVLVSIGVSVAIVGLMMHMVAQIADPADRPRLLAVVRHALPHLIALYILCALSQGVLRAKRFNLLIAADPKSLVPGIVQTYLATAVRNMTVDMLPARLGEVSYIAMMNRGYRVAARTCISSLALSFMFDLIALLVIIAVLIGAQIAFSRIQGWLLAVAFLLFAVILSGLLLLFLGLNWAAGAARRLLGHAKTGSTVAKVIDFLDELAAAMTVTRRAGVFVRTFWLSMGIRAFKYAGLYFLFKAVVTPTFETFAAIPVFEVLTALISAEGAASSPIPAFMSFGVYEAGGAMALIVLGFDKAQSMLTMLGIHIWSQLIDYAIGGAALVVFMLTAYPKKGTLP